MIFFSLLHIGIIFFFFFEKKISTRYEVFSYVRKSKLFVYKKQTFYPEKKRIIISCSMNGHRADGGKQHFYSRLYLFPISISILYFHLHRLFNTHIFSCEYFCTYTTHRQHEESKAKKKKKWV